MQPDARCKQTAGVAAPAAAGEPGSGTSRCRRSARPAVALLPASSAAAERQHRCDLRMPCATDGAAQTLDSRPAGTGHVLRSLHCFQPGQGPVWPCQAFTVQAEALHECRPGGPGRYTSAGQVWTPRAQPGSWHRRQQAHTARARSHCCVRAAEALSTAVALPGTPGT